MRPIHRPALAPVLALLVVLALGLGAGAAEAQTITQRYDFLGWTATGNEVVSRVTVAAKGISEAGDPVDWSYTLLEVANARSGEVLNTYRSGTPRGEAQRAWEGAKSEGEGEKILASLGVIAGVPGASSPQGELALVTTTGTAQGDAVITASCPGCVTCESRLRLQLLHGADRKLYTVREHARAGAPYPPDDVNPDCPELRAAVYWHPQGDRFAVLLSDQLRSDGSRLETLSVSVPAQDSGAWSAVELPPSAGAQARERLTAEVQQVKAQVAEAVDPHQKAILLTRLGDLHRGQQDLSSARGYYGAALEFDKNALRASLGIAACDLLGGKTREATQAVSRLERLDRSGALAADLGLFWISAGDTRKAAKHLQRAVDGGGGADFTERLRLGLRILDVDLSAGMAYLDNLLAATPENPDADLSALLQQTWRRMAREGLHSRDFEAAAAAIARLPRDTPEVQHLALLHAALAPGDSARVRLVQEKVNALLSEDPGACDLYFARAMLHRRALQPALTIADLQASLVCDPEQPEARFYLGDLLAAAGNLPAARESFAAFLRLAPQRSGDRATRLRREHVERLLPRLGASAVILLSSECTTTAEAVTCRGVLRNNTSAPAQQVAIRLTATSTGKRPQVTQQGDAALESVAPGASVDFAVRIPRPDDADRVELTLGRDDAELKLNQSEVAW